MTRTRFIGFGTALFALLFGVGVTSAQAQDRHHGPQTHHRGGNDRRAPQCPQPDRHDRGHQDRRWQTPDRHHQAPRFHRDDHRDHGQSNGRHDHHSRRDRHHGWWR